LWRKLSMSSSSEQTTQSTPVGGSLGAGPSPALSEGCFTEGGRSATPGGTQPPKREPMSHSVRSMTEETGTSFGMVGLRFLLRELLGEGSFGAVYRCAQASDGASSPDPDSENLAVKVIDARRLSLLVGHPLQLVVPRLRREVEILFLLSEQHPGILRLRHVFFSQTTHKFYLITELCRGGDLFSAIVARGKPFGERDGKVIFGQIVDAVAFCHSKGVAHRDLKLENCLLEDKESLKVKLCDYGQAKVVSGDGFTDTSKTLTTTPSYTAPEVACAVSSSSSYDAFKADSFALGVMLYALLCNALPDAAKGPAYERHRLWSKLSDNARELIQALLCEDPAKRPLPKDLTDHPWLAKPAESPTPQRTPSGTMMTRPRGGSTTTTPGRCSHVVETLLGVQDLISALQAERGTACWIVGSEEDSSRLDWQIKFSNERLDTAIQKIVNLLTSGQSQAVDWIDFSTTLRHVPDDLKPLRALCHEKIKTREEALDMEEDVAEIFDGFCNLVFKIITAMHNILPRLSESMGICRTTELRLRFLQLASEQLARERGLISGYLGRPETLRRAVIVRKVAEVIGARKLLIGTMSDSSSVVGASSGGMSIALGLGGSPLLDASDLAALEAIEDRAMAAKRLDQPAVAEWWYHLSKAVDKVHQHVMVSITEYSCEWKS